MVGLSAMRGGEKSDALMECTRGCPAGGAAWLLVKASRTGESGRDSDDDSKQQPHIHTWRKGACKGKRWQEQER